MSDKHEQQDSPEVSGGALAAVSRELHRAIDQVWGGIFQVSVRMEKERQASAREAVEPKR